MARVKDLWFATIRTKDADGKTVTSKRKTARHPDRGGSKDAKRWLAIWIDPDGKEKSEAFAKQIDAKKHAEKMEGDADRGEYVDPKAGKDLFGDVARRYLRLR